MNKKFILLLLIFFLSIYSCVYATGNDAYTVSLLHCNGADQSTTFTDDAAGGTHTWTAAGNAQLDTAQKKFGTASLLLDGTGDYIKSDDSADWYFGQGNFTIDFQVRFNVNSGHRVFVSQYLASENYWMIQAVDQGGGNYKIYFLFVTGSVTVAYYNTTNNWAVSTGVWYHLALVRSGPLGYLFIDGVSQALTVTTAFGTRDVGDVATELHWGVMSTDSYFFNGWLDECRISKGIARWTTDFTPPTEEYNGAVGQVIIISSD